MFRSFFYKRFVKKGDCIIDCGFNVGSHLLPLIDIVGESGLVYGFEANPDLVSSVSKRISGSNVKLFNTVLADAVKPIEFSIYDGLEGLSHITHGGKLHPYLVNANIKSEGHRVLHTNSSTLDDYCDTANFIKLDLEGADFLALKGANNLLNKSRPLVIFEFFPKLSSDQYGFSKKMFFHYFDNINYILFDIHGNLFTESE